MPGFIAATSSRTVRATTRPASRMMRSSAGDLRMMIWSAFALAFDRGFGFGLGLSRMLGFNFMAAAMIP